MPNSPSERIRQAFILVLGDAHAAGARGEARRGYLMLLSFGMGIQDRLDVDPVEGRALLESFERAMREFVLTYPEALVSNEFSGSEGAGPSVS